MNFEVVAERPPSRWSGGGESKYAELRAAIIATVGTANAVKVPTDGFGRNFVKVPGAVLRLDKMGLTLHSRRVNGALYLWAERREPRA